MHPRMESAFLTKLGLVDEPSCGHVGEGADDGGERKDDADKRRVDAEHVGVEDGLERGEHTHHHGGAEIAKRISDLVLDAERHHLAAVELFGQTSRVFLREVVFGQ